jgi:hypothetical protein
VHCSSANATFHPLLTILKQNDVMLLMISHAKHYIHSDDLGERARAYGGINDWFSGRRIANAAH